MGAPQSANGGAIMSGTPSPEEVIGQGRQVMKEGMEAGLAMLTRAPQPDVFQFWMPFFNQSMAPLAQLMSQGASAEVLRFWKGFLDQGIESWAKALEAKIEQVLAGLAALRAD